MISLIVIAVLSSSPVTQERCFARAVDGGQIEVSPDVCAALKRPTTYEQQLWCVQLGFVPPGSKP